jgi:hypothetical protein
MILIPSITKRCPSTLEIFNNLYTYNAILAILDATNIGLRVNNNEREEEETYNQDSWDLESLNSSKSSIESS